MTADNSDSVKSVHAVRPHRARDGRARCRLCGSAVVGTPAGWFHADDGTVEPVDPPEGWPEMTATQKLDWAEGKDLR